MGRPSGEAAVPGQTHLSSRKAHSAQRETEEERGGGVEEWQVSDQVKERR